VRRARRHRRVRHLVSILAETPVGAARKSGAKELKIIAKAPTLCNNPTFIPMPKTPHTGMAIECVE
jgi:hypothetical protein